MSMIKFNVEYPVTYMYIIFTVLDDIFRLGEITITLTQEGGNFASVLIGAIIDETYEDTETFFVSVVSTTTGAVVSERAETAVTIINIDRQLRVV